MSSFAKSRRLATSGGVPVFLEESHAVPLVSLTLAFRPGAAVDPIGKEGLSRAATRMLRRGCEGMDAFAIAERVDALGAEIGGDVSAGTVSMHLNVIERAVAPAVELLAHLFATPTFDEAELGKLLRETEGELIDARDDDRTLVTRYFRRAMFEGHPYGRRIAGQVATLRTLSRADVVSAYRRLFARGAVTIGFAGAIDETRALALAEKLVAALPEGERADDPIVRPAPKPGRRLVFVDKPDRTQTQILIGCLGAHPREPDFIPLQVATTVFGGTFTSRLMRAVRSERGWSYGAYARNAYERHPDALTLWTFPAAKDAAACIALELELLTRFREDGVTDDELAFARRYLVRSHAFDHDTPSKRLHLALDAGLYDLPEGYVEHWTTRVEATTRDEANAAVRAHVHPEDLLVAVVGTRSEIGDAIAAAIPGLAETIVVPYDAE